MSQYIRDNKKSSIKSIGLPFLFAFGLIIGGYFFYTRELKEIRTHSSITSGIIYDYDSGNKGGLVIKVKFFVEAKAYYTRSKYIQIPAPDGNDFIGKSIPIIYSYKDPNKNRILLFKYEFDDFGLAYPDSLRWALQYCTQ